MGLIINDSAANFVPKNFLSISRGKIVARRNKRDEQGNTVKDANGNYVQETIYSDGISGTLKAIGVRENVQVTFNGSTQMIDFVDITIHDEGEDFILSLDKTSGFLESIVMALATVPSFAGHKIAIKVWNNTKDGKDFTNISLRLDDEKLGWLVAPKDRPALRKVVVNGKEMWDRMDRVNFVMEHLAKVQTVLAGDTQATAPEAPAPALDEAPADMDDLPM